VIMMTAFGDMQTVRSTLKAGAVDFLEKPVDPDTLLASVREALDADAALRDDARDTLAAERQLNTLTPREKEVLDLVTQGSHYREIAAALGISPRTVEVHRARIMEKLQVRNISQLVRLSLTANPPQKIRAPIIAERP
jgi:RNA polymerase sigma factor (sigma-70 family)